MNARLEELRAKYKQLSSDMDAIRSEIIELEIKKTGIAVGDTVISNGKTFKVAKVEPKSWGKPWLMVYSQLKSGKFSQYSRNLYTNWEKV